MISSPATVLPALRRLLLSLALLLVAAGAATTRLFPVTRYGAKGDGVTVDTAAIQRALDAAAKQGGTVVFHPGTYLTGALFVKSGTTLRVDAGVTLRGVRTLAGYPILPTRIAGIELKWPAALINVYRQSHVTLEGSGVIDGDGSIWWKRYWALRRQYQSRGLRWAADYDCQRPRLIQIYDSGDVSLRGLHLERSGLWTVHICYSHAVTVDGITIRNNIGGRGPSTDGIDIDSSSHVLVERCDISGNDDAICLKSGRDADGLRVNRPTDHVVVRDCVIRDGAAGITFGSETSGGFHDIDVSHLTVLKPVPAGILFKSAHTRGGHSSGIRIHDLTLKGVRVAVAINMNWNPSYSYAVIPPGIRHIPSYWKVLATPVPHAEGLPHFRDVRIWNVTATGAQKAFSVEAYPDAPLRDFRFDHITIDAATAGAIRDADHWQFTHTVIKAADGSHVTLKDDHDISGLARADRRNVSPSRPGAPEAPAGPAGSSAAPAPARTTPRDRPPETPASFPSAAATPA